MSDGKNSCPCKCSCHIGGAHRDACDSPNDDENCCDHAGERWNFLHDCWELEMSGENRVSMGDVCANLSPGMRKELFEILDEE